MTQLGSTQGAASHTANTHRDHPFKTSAFFRVGGVKNLPTDGSKKLPTVGG